MKRRLIAILLAGGLMLGLCGCGSDGTSSMPAPVEQEETDSTPTDVTEDVALEEVEGTAQEGYSIDDLVNMWSSGELTREDLESMVAAGEVSPETNDGFLCYMAGDEVFDATWWADDQESEDIEGNIDTSSLLTAHVFEVEDSDGYKIRETIELSPIFTGENMETVYALWEALGNDVASFPSEQSLRDENRMLTNYELEYIIGTCMIENLTDGFPITPDKPRTYAMSLTAEGDGDVATLFNDRSVSVVMCSDQMVYYSDILSVAIGDAKMVSDTWGPYTFVIVLPNMHTPSQPDGYRYDKIQVALDFNTYDPYDCPDYDPLTLEYFEEGGN